MMARMKERERENSQLKRMYRDDESVVAEALAKTC